MGLGAGMTSGPLARVRGALRSRIARGVRRARGDLDLDALVALGLQLGPRAFVARGAYLDPGRPWLISIGADSVIAPGVMVFAHDAGLRLHTGYTLLAPVHIGQRVYVGAGAIVLPGTTIGDGCVVGAGAVLKGAYEAGSLVVGNPGRAVGDVASVAERHRAQVAAGPTWPADGWSRPEITSERRARQRTILRARGRGYVAGRAAREQA